jgi:catechol 2,3-dioxygenase-like lactoylglutathione lyase family enzyme
MALQRLSHVNLRTTNLEAMSDFYRRVLGFPPGKRPPFSFPGVWLYCGDQPVVHLVGVAQAPQPNDELRLQHFAFDATDYAGFVANLDELGVPYRVGQLPSWGVRQVHLNDPDGNHLHVDFQEG